MLEGTFLLFFIVLSYFERQGFFIKGLFQKMASNSLCFFVFLLSLLLCIGLILTRFILSLYFIIGIILLLLQQTTAADSVPAAVMLVIELSFLISLMPTQQV
ncbi:hypothetical protein J2Z65_006817 [Paenibacillus aceris]|uniref:Uncharacterized protein n=1 Tax=Paenibacillus aceris TaxID=869555 RepID=A0ABS4I9K7_9BACL|nr:hypothetical protein [Paenibacillus aceris]